jgi:hypothetical protein
MTFLSYTGVAMSDFIWHVPTNMAFPKTNTPPCL